GDVVPQRVHQLRDDVLGAGEVLEGLLVVLFLETLARRPHEAQGALDQHEAQLLRARREHSRAEVRIVDVNRHCGGVIGASRGSLQRAQPASCWSEARAVDWVCRDAIACSIAVNWRCSVARRAARRTSIAVMRSFCSFTW